MRKLSLTEFLHTIDGPAPRKSLPKEPSVSDAGLLALLTALKEHAGDYEIDSVIYDYVMYSGNDSLYFCSGFNMNTGRVINETLFVTSAIQIDKTSDNTYVITESPGERHTLILRSPHGQEN